MQSFKKILVLAPHPDDGEFGAGASIHRWVSAGAEVRYVAFSPCLKSLPEGSTSDLLGGELKEAVQKLGMSEGQARLLDYPVREFPAHRQAILEDLVQMRKDFRPDLVLVPNSTDIHQDHQVIHEEAIRAFKHCSILGYELPWNNMSVTTNYHVALDEENVQAKLDALHCYRSQEKRIYLADGFLHGLARVRGVQVGHHLAEAFEVIRLVQ
ncbi:MAG: PIG-L family deacetylase [Flavobacteriales bacterium]|nr:PIG-L family deacetylase [Flavobacteriales bacterium]